jgi:hypothetical protein
VPHTERPHPPERAEASSPTARPGPRSRPVR